MDLITASRIGDLHTATTLLAHTPDSIRTADTHGNTALHTAAQWGQAAVAGCLLEAGSEANARNTAAQTPLMSMVAPCTMLGIMRLLLDQGADINAVDRHGNSALSLSAECIQETFDWGYHHGTTQFLLEAGAIPDARTALILNDLDRVEELVQADPPMLNHRYYGGCLPDGFTLLHHACDRGNIPAAKLLLRLGADLEPTDTRGRPPLYLAAHTAGTRKAQAGTELAELLIENNASQNIFTIALLGTAPEMASQLTTGTDRHRQTDQGGNTPLHLAAWNGKTDMVRCLLAAGANANTRNARDESPLELATTYCHGETIKTLLDAGAYCDIFTAVALGAIGHIESRLKENPSIANAHNRYGETPLSWTQWTDIRGDGANAEEVRRFLAANGAQLDLESAAALGDLNTVSGMLEQAPDLSHIRHTALHAAAAGQTDMLELLIQHNAPLEARTTCRRTPLFEASARDSLEAVDLLVRHGADIEGRDNYGDTPLVRAADHGNKAMVQLLLERGADPDLSDYLGGTSLHWAALNGHTAIASSLLKHHANPNAKGWGWWNNDKTAYDLAIEHGNQDLAQLLAPG
jgi:uncharacterized protein